MDASLIRKLWGLKFLIEDFFYKKKDLEKAKAVSIDKIQTFWMYYSPFLKEAAQPDKKTATVFLNFLRNRITPIYALKEKPAIDEVAAWFSSKAARERFLKIYSSKNFDYSNPNDVVLAFNLADGILQKPEMREYAVLESLYFKKRGAGKFSDKRAQEIQDEFSIEFHSPDKASLRQLLEGSSEEEIRDAFRVLTDDVVRYFVYQKKTRYPVINIGLFKMWVEDVLLLIGSVIDRIKANALLDNKSHYEKYFPNTLGAKTPLEFRNPESLLLYIDDGFNKHFTNATNDLTYLIMTAFSNVSLDFFGVCSNEACRQRKVFVKFPKANREFCSNSCAAYAGTYRKRASEKEQRKREQM